MFILRKVAAVSGLVGSLAVSCVGAGHVYADGSGSECRDTARGGTVCLHKAGARTGKDGTHVIEQTQDCPVAALPRVLLPGDRLVGGGSAGAGPIVACSTTAELPKGFKRPRIEI